MAFVIPGLINGILLGGSYALAALGLSLVFGVMRVINMAQGDIMVAAAYLSFVIVGATGLDPLLSMFIVAPLMFVLGYILHGTVIHPVLNRGMMAGVVTTCAIALILQNILISIFTSDARSLRLSYAQSGVQLAGITIPISYLLCFALAVVISIGIHLLLTRTSFGRKARAASENPEVASLMGVDVNRIYKIVFGLATALSAVAGVVTASIFAFTPMSGMTYLLKGFIVVVLGGLGNVFGTLIAGLIIGGIEGLGTTLFGGGYRDLVTYVVFLVILLIRPSGLLGGGSAR